MKTQRPSSSRIPCGAARSIAIAALALCVGCASNLPADQLAAFEPMRGPITTFARHPMVCVPTSLGNMAGGLVGGPLALLVYPFVWPATFFTADDDYLFQAYGTTFWGPVLLMGGATGALFLGPAMLFDEDPCTFGITEIEARDDGDYADE